MPDESPSVNEFLATLPVARRKELERVRSVVRENLPAGYAETLTKGMIVYEVPLERYADTYNGHALWYAALASQKAGLTLHLMVAYGSASLRRRLQDGFEAAGKKLDMGKACIRFRTADDLALDVIAEVVASTPLDRFVALAQAARRR
jgi:Domain of unknown function (DU1801)